MAKGSIAKETLTNFLINALSSYYAGTDDKKRLLFNLLENGEPCTIAVALTCPKNITTDTPAAATLNPHSEDVTRLLNELGLL
jgi:hypothetical protein